jgi:hypothetical protein
VSYDAASLIEPRGKISTAARVGLNIIPVSSLPTRAFEIVQALPEPEVLEVAGAELVAQERRELLVLLQDGVLEVGAIDIMAMLDLVDDGGELAGHLAVQSLPEDLGDLVGC